ncbi:hypothetical protein CYMTET_5907 [Cymbomonas tetramitiformis]|uniref:Uncharacterized protein n=1 Tax=Cymbomonas tetramitiformis TaxID=36881 RepID=A0AAE0GY55_9CHLO|nr:hypothetical protein CYMTET_5907 [Cymbomonas tetramitiformis]
MSSKLAPYEKERLENIKRNHQRMADLGIKRANVAPVVTDTSSLSKSRRKATRKRLPEADEEVIVQSSRKSARLASMEPVIYTTFDVDEDMGDAIKRGRNSRQASGQITFDPADLPNEGEARRNSRQEPRVAPPPAEGSLRTLDADVRTLDNEWLGKQICPPVGSGAMKAAVMALLRGSSTPPKHNKYSGIQEWRNSVTLFVNVRDKTGEMSNSNLFLAGGRQMTWYAQPSQTEETPVIRLILDDSKIGEDAKVNSAAPHTESWKEPAAARHNEVSSEARLRETSVPVQLFCRQDGLPYVYCGKLRLVSHDARVRPMKFIWELMDLHRLRQCEAFQELLGTEVLPIS